MREQGLCRGERKGVTVLSLTPLATRELHANTGQPTRTERADPLLRQLLQLPTRD